MPDYAKELNAAQYQAATAPAGHTLVVAGAGTGKTRTIVYRLAWLIEQGMLPEEILLLTFTRKAANEMLSRASHLVGTSLHGLTGGTFHAFAFGALRSYKPLWLEGRNFTLMDATDINQAIKTCREDVKIAKKDSSFPKTQTIVGLLSRARNKELTLAEIVRQDSYHLLPHVEALTEIMEKYRSFKRERGLLDYDDLLFDLEALLEENDYAARALRNRFQHILVDEYQDTNLVQARLVRSLAEPGLSGQMGASVMAVGDEAQSIYAFRGANVQNILDFPKQYPGCQIIRLEQNYRSTQPILDVANGILARAEASFKKNLFTTKPGGHMPGLIRPFSDATEAALIVRRIEELLQEHKPHEIAVLFRAGFHSYPLENALHKAQIPFRKYGGLRFIEAAHIKDLISFARLAINPLDFPAFSRIALMHKGIGPKTMGTLHAAMMRGDSQECNRIFKRFPAFQADLEFINKLAARNLEPLRFMDELQNYYRPRLEQLYLDDWPSRLQGIEEILHMSAQYENLEVFMADLALDAPEPEDLISAENTITLSTVHSAKGLEWNAVILLDAVEERFPSRHAMARAEDFEEERRLFYVACTRARQSLDIYAPTSLYGANGGMVVSESPFIKELPRTLFARLNENYGGKLYQQKSEDGEIIGNASGSGLFTAASRSGSGTAPDKNLLSSQCKSGYCRHKIFGRGKIIEHLDEERVRVNFPGFGLKVILADYLLPEE